MRFTHSLAPLPQDVACRLLDLVPAPPVEPYETLRQRLIQMCSLNEFQGYQALQSLPLLSDQRPTELMDKMLILKMTHRFFSSEDYSWIVFQLISALIYCLSPLGIPGEWPSKLTNCGRSVAIVLQFKPSLIINLRMFMLCRGVIRQKLFVLLGPGLLVEVQ